MREPVRDKHRLEHIVSAIKTILERADGMTLDELTSDKIVFAGIVYYTMIIGEAAYKLSPGFTDIHPQVDWKVIANMRHHLVHGYYQVSAQDVWDVIKSDLIPLLRQVESILQDTDWSQWDNNVEPK